MNVFIARKGTHFWFLFAKAFDSVEHEKLWDALIRKGMGGGIFYVLWNLYTQALSNA